MAFSNLETNKPSAFHTVLVRNKRKREKRGLNDRQLFYSKTYAKKHMKKLMGSVALETVHYYSEHLFEIKSRHNEMKDQYKVFLPT